MNKDQYPFDFKYNPKYRIKNEKNLIDKINSNKVNIVPNFGWNSLGNGIAKYCLKEKKYFLVLTRIQIDGTYKDSLSINYSVINRHHYKVVEDNLKEMNLKKELLTSYDNMMFNKHISNFSTHAVLVIDKNLTFGRGYAVTSAIISKHIPPRDISLNIFYSFNEDEIKSQILKLLEPNYRIENTGI